MKWLLSKVTDISKKISKKDLLYGIIILFFFICFVLPPISPTQTLLLEQAITSTLSYGRVKSDLTRICILITTELWPNLISGSPMILTIALVNILNQLIIAASTLLLKISTINSLSVSIKFLILISLLVFIRGGIPRYRYDFLTKLGWIKFLSWILAGFLVALLLILLF